MKTADEIIAYLEKEMADANEKYNQAKGNNAQEAFCQLIKEDVIKQILENITK